MMLDPTKKLHRKLINSFMDVFVLAELRKNSLSGYDVIGLIHRKHGILMSSGTVYNLMYSLERDGLIKGVQNQRKRLYALTEKGEQRIKAIAKSNGKVQSFLRTMLFIPQG